MKKRRQERQAPQPLLNFWYGSGSHIGWPGDSTRQLYADLERLTVVVKNLSAAVVLLAKRGEEGP